jgi:5-methylcytosine-specific restriction endonuclease McrA
MKKISDKRKAKGEVMCWNSTIKAKVYILKKSPIRKVSKKSATLWNKARNECFEKWGKKCFLCGETQGELHCHHWQATRSQEPSRKYDLDNLVPLCKRCHSHNGVDKRFYELKNDIENKMKGL